jgi:regulator of sirC expression with transglutaminase-like and TPR domain
MRLGAAEEETEIAPADYLARLGQSGDGPHDIATAALMLAALDHPEKKLAPFRAHLAELAQAARAEVEFARNAEAAARALGQVVAGRYGYDGERMHFDDSANADLLQVIERRRGLPVALGILYIHAGRGAGLHAQGLFAPSHFLLKIMHRGSEALIDPFNGGAVLDRESLTPSLGVPVLMGEPVQADEPAATEPVSDTDVLLRLQNNIRNRALKNHDAPRAIEIGRRMTSIAPRRPALWLDLGRLQEASAALSSARLAYVHCIQSSCTGDAFHNEATLALETLKRRIN